MKKLVDLESNIFKYVAKILLQDKTTKKNIIWATDTYEELGSDYSSDAVITSNIISGMYSDIIQPRVYKSQLEQANRTKKKAEVFTPTWICNKMNNFCDAEWFSRENVFNTEVEDNTWVEVKDNIVFPEGVKKKTWKDYVDCRILEITCGEAPYLVSRYDATTGDILPINHRIGILDRKLRVVNENATDDEWMKWTTRAFESTYGYEYQGDNLLVARINLMMTFVDHYEYKWNKLPGIDETQKIANIIAWNLWQMDGLKGTVPVFKKPEKKESQVSLFAIEENIEQSELNEYIECKVYNWRKDGSFKFNNINNELIKEIKQMKFDFVIGNPPYQQDSNGANESDTPLYHFFYDAAFSISKKVELITPARFLFDAGYTPKKWNESMLNDKHFKVLYYEAKSNKIFSNTDIKGGIAIGYRDEEKEFGNIGTFTVFEELNTIKEKVWSVDANSLCDIITNRGLYRYSDLAYKEKPDEMKKTADARIAPSAFERMPELFTELLPDDGEEYIQIYGNIKNQRYYRWIRKDYVKDVENVRKYKVIIAKASGSGAFGELLSTPLVLEPFSGFTETYISIGETNDITEANAILKYVKSKFVRTLLGILKVTQNNAKATWKYVPLQDFTKNSDIDWTASVAEIDKQLYKKYGLSEEEIEFIETKVKEMV